MVMGWPQCGQLLVVTGWGAGLGAVAGVAGLVRRLVRRSQAAPRHFLEQ